MLEHKKIRVGNRYVEGFSTPLLTKSFVLLKGKKGYLMCGYLNLKAAEKFHDVAAMVVGVSDLEGALNATIHDCTSFAKRLGIYKGQPVKEALKILA